MKQLRIITVQPIDRVFNWTLRVQLTNFRKFGYSQSYTALIWISHDKIAKGIPEEWMKLATDFPEVKFIFYYDTENFLRTTLAFNYIPLLRPHCLRRYFADNPSLKDDAILYIDADVLFTKYLDFAPFLQDDICYLSQAGSYVNATYFDSKVKDVLPDKLEAYKKIDVLEGAAKQLGISREICEKYDAHSGAAQYLLKNIDDKFWADVADGCMMLNVYLGNINKKYFASEDKGFQRWCADIWAVVWNLWKRDMVTICPPELDFAWASDLISRWEEVYIYHDAGALRGSNLFDKRKLLYVNNIITPFEDDLSFVDPAYCSVKYVEAIQAAKP